MVRKTKITGMNEVMKNLNAEIQAIKGRSMTGLIKFAVLIRRSMDETPPLIPIDTSNLIQSWMPGTPIRKSDMIGLIIGFSANYAVFVHEMVDKSNKKINWSRPGSGPKFLEASLKRNKDEGLRIIGENARIK